MMRTIFLKASITAAALAFAQQAQAQQMALDPVQPLIAGSAARGGIQPAGDPAKWVTAADYPDAAVADRASGLVSFRLEVDDAGLVSGCKVTKGSGSEALDKATCSLLRRRARFLPGRNADNEPIGGSWGGTVTWSYPQRTATT
jgi:protein TonB